MQTSPSGMRRRALGLIALCLFAAPAAARQALPGGTGGADAPVRVENGGESGTDAVAGAVVESAGQADVDGTGASGAATGFEVDTTSLYVFRGLAYSAGPVTQSTAWASINGLYLYAWSNIALPAAAGSGRLDEVDLGVSYALERGDLAVEPAVNVYLYRLSEADSAEGIAAHTTELSVTLSYAMGRTTLFTTQMVDAASCRGAYFGELGARHERALTADTSLLVSARLGWASARFNREYLGLAVPGVGLAGVGVSLTKKLGRHLYLKPHAELTVLPDAAIRAQVARPRVGRVGLAVGVVR